MPSFALAVFGHSTPRGALLSAWTPGASSRRRRAVARVLQLGTVEQEQIERCEPGPRRQPGREARCRLGAAEVVESPARPASAAPRAACRRARSSRPPVGHVYPRRARCRRPAGRGRRGAPAAQATSPQAAWAAHAARRGWLRSRTGNARPTTCATTTRHIEPATSRGHQLGWYLALAREQQAGRAGGAGQRQQIEHVADTAFLAARDTELVAAPNALQQVPAPFE